MDLQYKMKRFIRLGVIIGCVCLGFAPAIAQDVFINRNKDSGTEKPTLYIKRSKSSYNQKANLYAPRRVNNFRVDKIELAHNAKNVSAKIAIFKAWQEADREPETLEEITSYAASKRAMREAINLKSRHRLIAALEQERRAEDLRYATRGGSSTERRGEPRPTGYRGSTTEKQTTTSRETRRTIVRKPSVFVKPDKDQEKSRGVFTNFR